MRQEMVMLLEVSVKERIHYEQYSTMNTGYSHQQSNNFIQNTPKYFEVLYNLDYEILTHIFH